MKKNSPSFLLKWMLLFVFLSATAPLYAQKTLMTLHCGEQLDKCDTVSIEDFDANGQLLYKLKFGEKKSSIEYRYNEKNVLVEKIHRDENGVHLKSNYIYSDENGSWHTDSLIDVKGKLWYVFKRAPAQKPNRFIIEWFYKLDATPSSRQIIQYDEEYHEVSNSTCYTADNCVTYVYFYQGNRKVRSEFWAMEGANAQPVLKETEEFAYDEESGDQATSSVRFLEPAHTVLGRFKYVLMEQPILK